MKNVNPLFIIGSAGIAITALLHMLIAFLVEAPGVNTAFWVLYNVFLVFMIIGFSQILKSSKSRQ